MTIYLHQELVRQRQVELQREATQYRLAAAARRDDDDRPGRISRTARLVLRRRPALSA